MAPGETDDPSLLIYPAVVGNAVCWRIVAVPVEAALRSQK